MADLLEKHTLIKSEIEFSASKVIEYTGNESNVTIYVPVNEFLSKGDYSAHLFVDGQMVGSQTFTLK